MEGSAMDIPLLRVNGLRWKISLRQRYLKLMVQTVAFFWCIWWYAVIPF